MARCSRLKASDHQNSPHPLSVRTASAYLVFSAVAKKVPLALRHRNLRNGDGKLVKHVLQGDNWEKLITAVVIPVLPATIDDEEAGNMPVPLDFDRYLHTRRGDKCILSPGKGRRGRPHLPYYIKPRDPADAWQQCTLTQLRDKRWLANFTNVPDWVQEGYYSDKGKWQRSRAGYKTFDSFARPVSGRSITLAALVCWWAYGKPRYGHDQATHFACDQPRCLNPRHLGWGTAADNSSHAKHHRRTLRKQPGHRVPRHSMPAPRRIEYDV